MCAGRRMTVSMSWCRQKNDCTARSTATSVRISGKRCDAMSGASSSMKCEFVGIGP
ncbi:hypothetical protein D3C83_208480 [compost metagenome]